MKKASKTTKTKAGSKKAKAGKVVKKISSKKAKPVKKAAPKKTVKKSAPKPKASKPAVKAAAKKVSLKKSTLKVNKSTKPVKKIIKLAAKKVEVKNVKSAKDAKKVVAPEKLMKSAKEEKVIKLGVKKAEEKEKIKPVKVKPSRSKGGRKPKKKDGDDDEPEIVHDELIEQLILSTKKKKAGPKVPKILKTFVNPMTSLTVAPSENDGKKGTVIPKKEPKGKFELEYVIRTSAGILYEFITSPSGLSEWFADDVNIRDGIFTFFWDGSEQKAKLLGFKEDKFIRLRWMDKPEGTYFEFRIDKDELTGDTSLIIIDFADEASDMETSKLLWDSQVNKLLGVLGSN
ncbi:MAG: START-like domain-containing protein [Bacteroidia bacterium]